MALAGFVTPVAAVAVTPATAGAPEPEPDVQEQAAQWAEHRTPEGKSYYHNSRTQQTTWDRPQALVDLDSE